MKHKQPSRIRDTVYVIGAGFSKGLASAAALAEENDASDTQQGS